MFEPGIKFGLTVEQTLKVSEWNKELDLKNIEHHRKTMSDTDFANLTSDGTIPYYGAIGGALTYSFTPTGLGVCVVVKHSSGETLDLTDYENW